MRNLKWYFVPLPSGRAGVGAFSLGGPGWGLSLWEGRGGGLYFSSASLAIYFPKMSNSMFTTLPTRMSQKLVFCMV